MPRPRFKPSISESDSYRAVSGNALNHTVGGENWSTRGKHRLTPSHWQLSHMPYSRDSNPDCGATDRYIVVSGNALDHTVG